MKKTCELYLRISAHLCAAPDLPTLRFPEQVSAALITDLDQAPSTEALQPLITALASQNIAVLIENDAALAKQLNADGVHLSFDTRSLDEARQLLGDDKAIGMSCPVTRHEAMLAGEAGASYIAFSENRADDLEKITAMIRWWDEIFEVPCVGWGYENYDEDALRALVSAGADFLSLPLWRLSAEMPSDITRLLQLCSSSEHSA
jgi:thiamine-phosphate pyrophosphorylase